MLQPFANLSIYTSTCLEIFEKYALLQTKTKFLNKILSKLIEQLTFSRNPRVPSWGIGMAFYQMVNKCDKHMEHFAIYMRDKYITKFQFALYTTKGNISIHMNDKFKQDGCNLPTASVALRKIILRNSFWQNYAILGKLPSDFR